MSSWARVFQMKSSPPLLFAPQIHGCLCGLQKQAAPVQHCCCCTVRLLPRPLLSALNRTQSPAHRRAHTMHSSDSSSRSAPAFSTTLATSTRLKKKASPSAVTPSLLRALSSAPASSSNPAISTAPLMAAICSAKYPSRSRCLIRSG
eukprot:TRINITY_DN7898_c0_g1_i2.p1 TRINITY_DN7898_c0_g1~~TRINITY_DN7898_c0_g1_i2.p1  ORF type:complete len:147 (+),score=8.48 TRINITY_DN7898_c0_g1_i2:196-636(+)